MAAKSDTDVRRLEAMNRMLRDCIAEAKRLSERAQQLVRKYQEMAARQRD
jgi:hypothetical protein